MPASQSSTCPCRRSARPSNAKQYAVRRRVAVIANLSRPATRRALDQLREQLGLPGVTVVGTTDLAEAREAVYQQAARADALLFAGGDGTFTLGLTLLAEARRGRALPAVGVLPLGTGNALAHSLNLPTGVRGAREQLARALDPTRPLRTFRALEVAGLRTAFCGFGIDAQLIADHAASASALQRLGPVGRWVERRAGYPISIASRSLPSLLLQARPRVTLTNLGASALELDAKGAVVAEHGAGATLWQGPCTMAAASTIACFGFGLRMFQHAQRRADRFHVRASDAGLLEVVRNAPAAFAGRYASPRVHDFLAERVELAVSTPAPFEAGGEVMGELERVQISLGPTFPLIAP